VCIRVHADAEPVDQLPGRLLAGRFSPPDETITKSGRAALLM
jgi:hypothetical protein